MCCSFLSPRYPMAIVMILVNRSNARKHWKVWDDSSYKQIWLLSVKITWKLPEHLLHEASEIRHVEDSQLPIRKLSETAIRWSKQYIHRYHNSLFVTGKLCIWHTTTTLWLWRFLYEGDQGAHERRLKYHFIGLHYALLLLLSITPTQRFLFSRRERAINSQITWPRMTDAVVLCEFNYGLSISPYFCSEHL